MLPKPVETCIISSPDRLVALSPCTAMEDSFALALETSSDLGSVALGRGALVLDAATLPGVRMHAANFLPAVADLCARHSIRPGAIRDVFVSVGPGSFTGLRIGIAAARMLSLAGGARLVPVPTLEVIAQNALRHTPRPRRLFVMLDAKRANTFAAVFALRQESYVPLTDSHEALPEAFLATHAKRAGAEAASDGAVGAGARMYRERIIAAGIEVLPEHLDAPHASGVYRLGWERAQRGQFVDRTGLIPLYVRPPEAEEKWRLKNA